ncbi:alcohol dehydrogenase catalytic domain-containing protein [Massilimaliae timonensis]|uniref:Alcohol dehydrogenase catalytic domain-containing protein n=1 Tax=Massiliimalia timonensis TaxID=1987501 RepID=A0A8J6P129_9FIRM|nr:alcohol dehydrogenase catalytic domain-containing protein [Massiliimalia timonensis]MBC8610729.1 alcohol dehydrogenase catalytic domain-containing protein [Massiliimalia timonensis]
MKGVMKAAVFEKPETIVVKEIPIPECPDDGVLIRVEACGICGGDVRNFYQGLRADVGSQIMGHEIVGTVVEVGKGSRGFAVRDRVALAPDVSCGECAYCKRGWVNLCAEHKMLGTHFPGGFAQYIAISGYIIEHGFIEHIPDTLSFEDAVMAEPSSSVIACQNRNQVQQGDTVVIIGDGPIGCLHIEVARAKGASKIIMVGLARLEAAKEFHPDVLLDAASVDPVEEVRKLTNGIGADIIICANPVTSTQEQAVEMARKRGTIVLFGGVPKSAPMTSLNSNLIHYNELTVTGAFSYPSCGLKDALDYLNEKKITASKYTNVIVPLEKICDGIMLSKQGKALKAVVKPWME